jgi:hypothetical protein
VNEHEISRLSDLLPLQALKAAYCETVDACVKAGAAATARLGALFTEDVRADWMRRKGSATSDELFGHYLDEFRRTPNGWRISPVRFIQEG